MPFIKPIKHFGQSILQHKLIPIACLGSCHGLPVARFPEQVPLLSPCLSLSLMLSAFSPAAAASVLSTFRVIDILTSITALSGRKTCAYPTCLTPFCICLACVVVVAVVVYQVKALVTNVTRELLANDSSAFQTQETCLDQPDQQPT